MNGRAARRLRYAYPHKSIARKVRREYATKPHAIKARINRQIEAIHARETGRVVRRAEPA